MEELKKIRRVDDREMGPSMGEGEEREGRPTGAGGVGGEDDSERKALIRENKVIKQQVGLGPSTLTCASIK